AIRRRSRSAAREANATRLRAGRGRGVPDRRLRRARRRGGRRRHSREERGRVMATGKDEVKRLREVTGAGVMDCKRALEESKDVDELLEQAYIRDASKKVGELVTGIAAATGENVRVRRFKRFQLGQSNGEPN